MILRPLTLTISTQFLRDKALHHIEVTTLHWNPFLSVGGKRKDLDPKLEIFLERSREIESRRFDLWSVRLLLACSLDWSRGGLPVPWRHRAHHPRRPAQPIARSSAGPRIHYLDVPQTQPSSARLQRQQAGRGRLKPPGARAHAKAVRCGIGPSEVSEVFFHCPWV